jgi:type 1 fimbria pilin
MRVRSIFILLCTFLLSAVFASAQDITATISGTVRDTN